MTINPSFSQLLERIGERFYTERHIRKEKIVAVAAELSISHPVISQIENGRYKGLSMEMLHRLAEYYNMRIEEALNSDVDTGTTNRIIEILKSENQYLREKLSELLIARNTG